MLLFISMETSTATGTIIAPSFQALILFFQNVIAVDSGFLPVLNKSQHESDPETHAFYSIM